MIKLFLILSGLTFSLMSLANDRQALDCYLLNEYEDDDKIAMPPNGLPVPTYLDFLMSSDSESGMVKFDVENIVSCENAISDTEIECAGQTYQFDPTFEHLATDFGTYECMEKIN